MAGDDFDGESPRILDIVGSHVRLGQQVCSLYNIVLFFGGILPAMAYYELSVFEVGLFLPRS